MAMRPRLAAALAAIALLAGCPGITIQVPGPPGNTSPRPTASGGSSAPATKGSATPKPAGSPGTAGDCPDAMPGTVPLGEARHGVFAGKGLPAAMSKLADEAAVRAAIAKLKADPAAFACFQSSYPGATVAFLGVPTPAPMATPGPIPRPSPAPASLCTAAAPAATPTTGSASQGRYLGQLLPSGWEIFSTEEEVTEAVRKVEGTADWACFRKFYAGATTVYAAIADEALAPGPFPVATTRPSTLGPAACTADAPAAVSTTGMARHGRYNGQRLPNGYDGLASEAEVTATIGQLEGTPSWSCFQKFYPGATAVYGSLK